MDIIWTDQFDEPVEVVHPCRLTMKADSGQIFVDLETDPEIPEGDVPGLNISTSMGLIQVHIPRTQTAALLPGTNYVYDLFVSLESAYGGTQRERLVYGDVQVNKRVTQM